MNEIDYQSAFCKIKNGEKAIIDAARKHLPSQYDIDMDDEKTYRKWLSAIARAAIKDRA